MRQGERAEGENEIAFRDQVRGKAIGPADEKIHRRCPGVTIRSEAGGEALGGERRAAFVKNDEKPRSETLPERGGFLALAILGAAGAALGQFDQFRARKTKRPSALPGAFAIAFAEIALWPVLEAADGQKLKPHRAAQPVRRSERREPDCSLGRSAPHIFSRL